MARYLADLHLHSRYARACSSQLTIPSIVKWGKLKGLQVLGTGDFTHPLWLSELKEELVEVGLGIFRYRESETEVSPRRGALDEGEPYFVLTVETSHVYTQDGRGRRVHVMTWAPSFEIVDKINAELTRRGANLMSDGRPMTGLSLIELCDTVFGVDERCLIIPAHAWTPWYGVFGDKGGFDSLQRAFGDYTDRIYAVETGLSSDPAMNWQIAELENRRIVSFSDAHSPWKLGREATVFEFEDFAQDGFVALQQAIRGGSDQNKILSTVEFYPEEGKYHYTGHRKCGIRQSPQESAKTGEICPVCGERLTVGVLHRVEELASKRDGSGDIVGRPAAERFVRFTSPVGEEDDTNYKSLKVVTRSQRFDSGRQSESPKVASRDSISLYQHPASQRPPYIMLVPLTEIIAEARGVGVNTKSVLETYHQLVSYFGNEFNVLLKGEISEIAQVSGEKIAEGVGKVRTGDLAIEPGYDGIFGKVRIWGKEEGPEPSGPQEESLF